MSGRIPGRHRRGPMDGTGRQEIAVATSELMKNMTLQSGHIMACLQPGKILT